ncbi:LysR substrate-binding domain-containing protein [Crenobacter sp. SG2303]|uniref:LysR substrate-binding domain-containing protein n=1 Tax=Crenobacter oryzisoli TaxID=3056844 RepID=A0ABT7XPG1_9NEIS|nr:LysR family transcriptional regulator [Crenobacter sp. SG2303]MDN0075679.1 LysR substrate-binding domain-containing protein [Crenobacter sp. SG2303]
MTLDQLRIFVAVAEQQHVTRAANTLALSQSAVSSSIAALEAQYDIKLFHRIRRNIVLTDAGRQFLDEARAVLTRASSAGNMLSDLAGLRRGTLSLASSQTVANYWIPKVMQRFRTRYPGISLNLTITNTEQVVRQVDEGTVDLGFVEDQVDTNGLEIRAVAQDELMLVVAPTHPWAGHDSMSADIDMRDSIWVLREQGSGTRGIFEKMVRSSGVDPSELEIGLELPSNEAVRTAVEAGAGATVMSRLVAAGSLSAGTLTALHWPLPSRNFLMLRHEQRYVTEAMRAFFEMALE